MEKANVADTICDLEVDQPIDATPIDPPTISVKITVNSSPYQAQKAINLRALKLEID